MRGVFGTAFILAGLVCVYLFGALGIAGAKAMSPPPSGSFATLPFKALGANYPKDAVCLALGAAGLASGLWLLLRRGRPAGDGTASEGAAPGTTGSFARGFLLLSLGACAAWGVAYLGAVRGAPAGPVGGAAAVAVLAVALALLLGILSFFEKGKPALVVAGGWLLFLAAAGVGAAGFILSK
jgi:hypothetical protein